jgi:hypothetical protein
VYANVKNDTDIPWERVTCIKWNDGYKSGRLDPADETDLFESATYLQRSGATILPGYLPSMVIIYYANMGATEADTGFSWRNQEDNHFKTNFFVFGILTEDNKYAMINHMYLTSKDETVGKDDWECVTGFRENRWAIQ